MGDGQAQADAGQAVAAGPLAAEERLEDVRRLVGRQPAAPIFHAQEDRSVLAPGPHHHRSPRRAVLAGVLEQVIEELTEERRVDAHDAQGVSSPIAESKSAGAGVIRPSLEVVRHPPRQVHRIGLGPAAFGPRQQEQRFDDLPQADPLVADPLQDAAILPRRAIATERDLDLAEQGRQGGAELMRGIAGEPLLPVVRLVHLEEA